MPFQISLPHTGTPAPLLLQIQPDLQPPHCQYLLSPVLPYPSGTVSPLRQAARSFLLRHRHNSVYQTAAFSLPEKASLSALSFRTSSPRIPFPVYLQKYGTCWRSFVRLPSCLCQKRLSFQCSYPHLLWIPARSGRYFLISS